VSPSEVRAWLDRHGLAPHRSRGQNFLVDDQMAAKLVRLAGVEPGDRVIEIGTGLGLLTHALADSAARVVSIEIDAGLVRALRAEATLPDNVELIHADALECDLAALAAADDAPLRVVANLPYAVASPLLRRLLDLSDRLTSWSVMVQREVAERIAAGPGEPGYGSFAVLHAWCAEAKRGLDLHPRCFYPVPRVVSRFLQLTPCAGPRPGAAELARLEPFLRGAFAHRRKTLRGALRAAGVSDPAPQLAELGLGSLVRPEELAPPVWLQLARRLAEDRLEPEHCLAR